MAGRCEWCDKILPPSTRRGRRFCSDTHRKAASRAAEASPPPVPVDGPVTAAVQQALEEVSFDAVGDARAALALALARLVDGGSVPAAKELRLVLEELGEIQDPETLAFWAEISTPKPYVAPANGADSPAARAT